MKGRSTHSEGGSGRGSMTALTDWVLSHKRLVVGFWLVVFIAAVAALGPAGSSLSQQFNVPGREGFETNKELAAIYGAGGDVAPIVPVVTLPEGKTVDSPGVRAELDAALAKVEAALPESISASFASTGDRAFVSDDGRTTFALVYIPAKGGVDPGLEEASSAQAAVDGVTVGGSPVEVTGLDALRGSVGDIEGAGAGVVLGTLLAALGALLVLAFVFRSFMAFVPLLMALVAIPTTFLLVWPLASVTDVSVIVQFLVGLIGLGIAIDYALLVVVRWREERQQPGVTNELAVRNAMQHAGTAVVFSGTTVAISLLALLVLPVPFMRSIGVAGLLIALVSVAVAVTLLPVVLGDDRAAVRLATQSTRRAGQSWLVGLGASDRAPPLARGSRVDRCAGCTGGGGREHPAREPARLLALEGGACSLGPREPGGLRHRHRAALALRCARSFRRTRRCRAGVRAGRRCPQRRSTGRVAARRDGDRRCVPDFGWELAGGTRDARPPARRRGGAAGRGDDRW